jgi:DNA-binding transcriptional MerR regulator
MSEQLDINALATATDTSVRTLRYWVAEGILPPPTGRGLAATYGPGHRDRVTLIRRLQDAHQPLAAIRSQLEALDDAGVAAALAAPPLTATTPATALDYVQQVLGTTTKRQGPSVPDASLALPAEPPVVLAKRSTWERIALHPDIELHVRRPLARADQRRLDRLLAEAQRLFSGDG